MEWQGEALGIDMVTFWIVFPVVGWYEPNAVATALKQVFALTATEVTLAPTGRFSPTSKWKKLIVDSSCSSVGFTPPPASNRGLRCGSSDCASIPATVRLNAAGVADDARDIRPATPTTARTTART